MDIPEKTSLFIAIVQSQDAETAEEALSQVGLNVCRLPSTGSFLGRRNATLLIDSGETQKNILQKTLEENCRQRVEYIAIPMEGAPLPLPTPTPVTVGGATIFSIEVDHFEVI
ncbi:MAG: cyclic-di-AMP receptor [Anaerolineae bacterium]|nr:cyclic-di-AMP receptor [Anaerolineae bacterium]